jgi:hypothetical protein
MSVELIDKLMENVQDAFGEISCSIILRIRQIKNGKLWPFIMKKQLLK